MSNKPPITDADVHQMIDEIDMHIDQIRFYVQYEPQSVLSVFYPWVLLMIARALCRFSLWMEKVL